MNVMSEAYLNLLEADHTQPVAVIITTRIEPAESIDRLTGLGLTVTRTFSLISAIAAHGPAGAVLTLAQEPWVVSIEPDLPVKAA